MLKFIKHDAMDSPLCVGTLPPSNLDVSLAVLQGRHNELRGAYSPVYVSRPGPPSRFPRSRGLTSKASPLVALWCWGARMQHRCVCVCVCVQLGVRLGV